MEILTEPKHGGGGRGLAIALLATLFFVAIAVALWLFSRRPAEAPKAPPVAPRARTSPSPKATPALPAAPEARATPRPRAEPRPEAAAPTLRLPRAAPRDDGGAALRGRQGRRLVRGLVPVAGAAPAGLPEPQPAREAARGEDLELHHRERGPAAHVSEGRRGREEAAVSGPSPSYHWA